MTPRHPHLLPAESGPQGLVNSGHHRYYLARHIALRACRLAAALGLVSEALAAEERGDRRCGSRRRRRRKRARPADTRATAEVVQRKHGHSREREVAREP